jgi:hypothetical protein
LWYIFQSVFWWYIFQPVFSNRHIPISILVIFSNH